MFIKILSLIMILILFKVNVVYSSTPSLSELVVNHETKECAIFNEGDHCGRYELPAGWEKYGEYLSKHNKGVVAKRFNYYEVNGFEKCCNELGFTFIPKNIGIKTTISFFDKDEYEEGDRFFLYSGTRMSFNKIKIIKEGKRHFYFAKASWEEKQEATLVDADQIERIIRGGKLPPATEEDRFIYALEIQERPGEEFPKRFFGIPLTWSDVDTTDYRCENIDENCFLKYIKSIPITMLLKKTNWNKSIRDNPPPVTVEKIELNSIYAVPKKRNTIEGCNPTEVNLVEYEQYWYAF